MPGGEVPPLHPRWLAWKPGQGLPYPQELIPLLLASRQLPTRLGLKRTVPPPVVRSSTCTVSKRAQLSTHQARHIQRFSTPTAALEQQNQAGRGTPAEDQQNRASRIGTESQQNRNRIRTQSEQNQASRIGTAESSQQRNASRGWVRRRP